MRFKSICGILCNAFYDREDNSINRSGVEGLAEKDRTSVSITPKDEGYAPGEVQRDERSTTVR